MGAVSLTGPKFTHTQECEDCLAGTYAPRRGMEECLACEKGYAAPTSGMDHCVGCAAGSVAGDTGRSSCTLCDDGRYAHGNSTACFPCPLGGVHCQGGTVEFREGTHLLWLRLSVALRLTPGSCSLSCRLPQATGPRHPTLTLSQSAASSTAAPTETCAKPVPLACAAAQPLPGACRVSLLLPCTYNLVPYPHHRLHDCSQAFVRHLHAWACQGWTCVCALPTNLAERTAGLCRLAPCHCCRHCPHPGQRQAALQSRLHCPHIHQLSAAGTQES